jgi:hypothetical protein
MRVPWQAFSKVGLFDYDSDLFSVPCKAPPPRSALHKTISLHLKYIRDDALFQGQSQTEIPHRLESTLGGGRINMAGPYSADVPRLAQAGLTVLTVTGATAVYRTAQDAGSVAFAIGGYVALLLLFRALSAYERAHAHPGAERRGNGSGARSGASARCSPPCSRGRSPASCRGPSRWPSGLWLLMQRSLDSSRFVSIMVPEYGYQLPCRMIARESQRKVVILLLI